MNNAANNLMPGAGKSRFLHIVPDEKFIDGAHAIFEQAMPGAHDYLMLKAAGELRYVRTFHPLRLKLDEALRPDVLCQLPGYAAVFVHYLSAAARQLVASAPPETNFVWLGWGADYYHLIHKREQLLMPETREMTDKLAGSQAATRWRKILLSLPEGLANPIQSVGRFAKRRQLANQCAGGAKEFDLLNRFNFMAPVLREDFDAIAGANQDFRPRFVQWNYWTEGFGRAVGASPGISGRNLLLGNSATPENNHIEVMNSIADVFPPDRQIICPLSYGNEAYGDKISTAGLERFGARFIPLRAFIESDAYSEMLQSCSIVAMNHIRQQAMGNIIIMLWLGARVFLNHRNPINQAMARIGVNVHDIRELREYLQEVEQPPSACELQITRERLERQFGRDAILGQTRNLLASLIRPQANPTDAP